MPSATTPDNIWYLNASDAAPGPHTVTAMMAGSVQAALDGRQLQTYRWTTIAERDAQTGMDYGAIGYCEEDSLLSYYSVVTDDWFHINEELPDPQGVIHPSSTQEITATSWANLPDMPTITLDLTRDAWVQINLGAWLATSSSVTDVRASFIVTGATTTVEVPGSQSYGVASWGQVLYKSLASGTGTAQHTLTRVYKLNAGSNTITARAYRTGGSLAQTNYVSMNVTPLRWA